MITLPVIDGRNDNTGIPPSRAPENVSRETWASLRLNKFNGLREERRLLSSGRARIAHFSPRKQQRAAAFSACAAKLRCAIIGASTKRRPHPEAPRSGLEG